MRYSSLFLLLLLTALSADGQRAKSTLLSPSEAKLAARQCSRSSPSDFTDTWNPTTEDILQMESRLGNISKLKAKSCCIKGEHVDDPANWYLQYAALVWKGKRIIYINAISREPPTDRLIDDKGVLTETPGESWKTKAEIVCDGGTNWGVIYHLDTGKFSDLAVNGVG